MTYQKPDGSWSFPGFEGKATTGAFAHIDTSILINRRGQLLVPVTLAHGSALLLGTPEGTHQPGALCVLGAPAHPSIYGKRLSATSEERLRPPTGREDPEHEPQRVNAGRPMPAVSPSTLSTKISSNALRSCPHRTGGRASCAARKRICTTSSTARCRASHRCPASDAFRAGSMLRVNRHG